MQKGLLEYILIVILIFALSGCATTREASISEGSLSEEELEARTTLPVTAKLRFSDIPVPVGFKLIEDKSFVFQTEKTRVALLKYYGRAKIQDLVEFYKEQMLFYNWNLLNVVEYGKSVLNFERADQNCIVTIEPRGLKKVITISVAPKAQGTIATKTQNK